LPEHVLHFYSGKLLQIHSGVDIHACNLFGVARIHSFLGLLGPVVPAAEPLIEGDQAIAAIVHLEILVVQVVKVSVAIERSVIGEFKLLEADVTVERAVSRHVELQHGH